MKLYREVKASKGEYVLTPADPENTESILHFVERIKITEEDLENIIRENTGVLGFGSVYGVGDAVYAIVSKLIGE